MFVQYHQFFRIIQTVNILNFHIQVKNHQIYFHKNPMFKEIVTFDGPMVENGFITLSEKPGIGVEINEDGMKKYATKGIPFFE